MLTTEQNFARWQHALEYGGSTHTIAQVIELLRQGKVRLFENKDGVIIGEIVQYPQFRAVGYWQIFGTLQDCLELDGPVSEWGRSEGCTVATAAGRKGWGRVGAPYGWRYHSSNFWKSLTGEH